MKQFATIVLCFVACVLNASAQTGEPRVNRDPKKAKFVTSDIDNFWRAFDLAIKESEQTRKTPFIKSNILIKEARAWKISRGLELKAQMP